MTIDLTLGNIEALIAIAIVVLATSVALVIVRRPQLPKFPVVQHFDAVIGFLSRPLSRTERTKKPAISQPLAVPLSPDAHWRRVTVVVEQALMCASTISEHQANAAQQLRSAEYALHTLLEELSAVMAPNVASPLQARIFSVSTPVARSEALAA